MNIAIRPLGLVLLLSACAAPPAHQLDPAEQRAHDQCRYEAEKATAAIINPFDKGWEKADLYRNCMRLKGYKR